jgi:hypothetical protein
VFFSCSAFLLYDQSLDAVLASLYQTGGRLDIADDDSRVCLESTLPDGFKEGIHIRAATRD